jgi:hypothetical protein
MVQPHYAFKVSLNEVTKRQSNDSWVANLPGVDAGDHSTRQDVHRPPEDAW